MGGFEASEDNCIMLVITDGHPRHDESSRDGRVIDPLSIGPVQFERATRDDDDTEMMMDDDTQVSSISCAAFYPNIGQRTLYFMLNRLEADGTFEIDGEPINEEMVRRDLNNENLLSVSLEDEIVSQSPISVKYTVSDDDSEPVETECTADLMADIDEDSRRDVVDSSPFDSKVTTPSAETFASGQRVDTPSELDDYYNRNVIIRNLLAGSAFEPFTYVVADSTSTPTRSTFESGISIDDYLGVDTSGNTKFFRISGEQCVPILRAAYANRLGNVKLDEFCDGINDEIDFTTAELGSAQYAWVDIDDGRLKLSEDRDEPIIHTLRVLPEINFAGQASYLFASRRPGALRFRPM